MTLVDSVAYPVAVAPTTPLNRLRAVGFSDEQARALAAADYDVLGFLDVNALFGAAR